MAREEQHLLSAGRGQRMRWCRYALAARLGETVSQERMAELITAELRRMKRLHARAEIYQSTVSRWERDEATPDLDHIEALARVAKLPVQWIAFSLGELPSTIPSPLAVPYDAGRLIHPPRSRQRRSG